MKQRLNSVKEELVFSDLETVKHKQGYLRALYDMLDGLQETV